MFEGQFDILVNSGGGQITLHSYSAGDHANSAFGELALATGRPHAARIVARTDGMFLLPSLLCVYVFCDLRMPSPFLSNQSICVLSQPNALLHKYSQKCCHSHRQVASVLDCANKTPIQGFRKAQPALLQAFCFSWMLTPSRQLWPLANGMARL